MATRRPCKRPLVECLDGDDAGKVYRFQILLPNGTSTRIILRDPGEEILLDEFILAIRKELEKTGKFARDSKRKILWNGDIYLEDMSENRIKKKICFRHFNTNKCHILRLHDGAGESVGTFQNMWDLTPDTDLLSQLPAEYTFETALADLIDNSLQAVWSNGPGERKFISVTVDKNEILIFDSGPGMDGSDGNSIVKWGKMGCSNHRASRELGIGGKPPYLMPFFGMFGYGGAIASMHLGRQAVVSSKTKESRKVYILHLAREALMNKSGSDNIWRTDGGIRDPRGEEFQVSPHGSFTEVHIREPKFRSMQTFKLQCLLKDIYFPYIQCDDVAHGRKTTMPIKFQVNGVDLAEIEGGEIAITNMHSCNGPEFIFQIRLLISEACGSRKSSDSSIAREANARLRCVYFPVVKGKESIDRILEELEAEGCEIGENFETFCRVSIRRLGRLLPDARWGRLPFMESKLRKGDKALLLKRCYMRVKCFVETDAGFSPTPSKTDLAHHDPFTGALKIFGGNHQGRESEAIVQIFKGGKSVNSMQLEREYQDWALQTHDQYDEEMDSGEDEPVIVVSPFHKKKLGISSDVIRVHKAIRRKGSSWTSGMKLKILKGAVGFLKNSLYAILEFILLEGFQGDVCGEARLICRPLGCSDARGCAVLVNNGSASIDIRDSLSFPINVIDSGKCQVVNTVTWNLQLVKKKQKAPSAIDVLCGKQCQFLDIGEFPFDSSISAGDALPDEIVAVIRPSNFAPSSAYETLDQKYIIKDEFEMSLHVKFFCDDGKNHQNRECVFMESIKRSSRKGFHGLYIFPLGQNRSKLFCQAGVYTFHFSVIYKDLTHIHREVKVTVKPASRVGKLMFSSDEHGPITDKSPFTLRVGSRISCLSVEPYDVYSNPISFSSLPEINVKICLEDCTLVYVHEARMSLLSNGKLLKIMDILVESNKLDMIRPDYEAVLEICLKDESFCEKAPCKVLPGPLHSITLLSSCELSGCLFPGDIIEELLFEMCDAYGNHVEEGTQVRVRVEGLCFQDHTGPLRKVDNHGCMDLSHLLKVVTGYGATVCVTIYLGCKMLFNKEFEVGKREMRVVSGIPDSCAAGSFLEDIVFGICDSNGVIDETIHGPYHTLVIASDSMGFDDAVQYSFRHGKCTVPCIRVPWERGTFLFSASHAHHPELCTNVEVYVESPKLEFVNAKDCHPELCNNVEVVESSKLEFVNGKDSGVNIFHSGSSYNGTLLLQDSSQYCSIHADILLDYVINDVRKVHEDITEAAVCIENHESKIRALKDQKASMTQLLDDLQASLEPSLLSQVDSLFNTREQIAKHIDAKEGTAAAVFCSLKKGVELEVPQENLVEEFVGIVALLGTVNDDRLSRVFAEYLTENWMLAVVLKSYQTAKSLEIYVDDGKVTCNSVLHRMASMVDRTIDKVFTAICLDELRPYLGGLEKWGDQRKLILPDPRLPSGESPLGFLGYAVNMINLDVRHLHTKTASGYGLRETLLYRLFGKLQVYQTRENIEEAKACIKHGAVSLDGGIMRDNGIICLGVCDPDIKFPVIPGPWQHSEHTIDILKQIEDKKDEMAKVEENIVEATAAWNKAMEEFRRKSDQQAKLISKLMGGPQEAGPRKSL